MIVASYVNFFHIVWGRLDMSASNHTPSGEWDEITYPFLNFNGTTVEI